MMDLHMQNKLLLNCSLTIVIPLHVFQDIINEKGIVNDGIFKVEIPKIIFESRS